MKIWIVFTALFFSQSVLAFTLAGSSRLEGWHNETLRIQYDPSACPISEAALTAAIDTAIEVWNKVPTSRLKLERGDAVSASPSQLNGCSAAMRAVVPVITCDTAMSVTIKSDANFIPAAATGLQCIDSGFELTYGFILLNAEAGKRTKIDRISPSILAIIVAHEIGHVLGLGHTSDLDALMYFDASEKTTLRLSQDDIDGISYLYPRNEPNGGKPFACANVDSGSSGPSGGALAEFLALLAVCGVATWMLKRAPRLA